MKSKLKTLFIFILTLICIFAFTACTPDGGGGGKGSGGSGGGGSGGSGGGGSSGGSGNGGSDYSNILGVWIAIGKGDSSETIYYKDWEYALSEDMILDIDDYTYTDLFEKTTIVEVDFYYTRRNESDGSNEYDYGYSEISKSSKTKYNTNVFLDWIGYSADSIPSNYQYSETFELKNGLLYWNIVWGEKENPDSFFYIFQQRPEVTTDKNADFSEKSTSFFYDTSANGITITKYVGINLDIEIPSQIDGKDVVAISNNAFIFTNVENVYIPSTVKSIGKYAFYNCDNLVTMTISPRSELTSIGDYAFYNCSWFCKVNIPSTVTSIGTRAFARCQYLNIECSATEKPTGWADNWNEYTYTTWGKTIPVYFDISKSDLVGTWESGNKKLVFKNDNTFIWLKTATTYTTGTWRMRDGVIILSDETEQFCQVMGGPLSNIDMTVNYMKTSTSTEIELPLTAADLPGTWSWSSGEKMTAIVIKSDHTLQLIVKEDDYISRRDFEWSFNSNDGTVTAEAVDSGSDMLLVFENKKILFTSGSSIIYLSKGEATIPTYTGTEYILTKAMFGGQVLEGENLLPAGTQQSVILTNDGKFIERQTTTGNTIESIRYYTIQGNVLYTYLDAAKTQQNGQYSFSATQLSIDLGGLVYIYTK